MSEPSAWLAERRPPPPMDLRPWFPTGWEGTRPHEALAQAGRAALERALAQPGRHREAAFHLLAADALITYACEAALDEDDPAAGWDDVLRTVLDGEQGGP